MTLELVRRLKLSYCFNRLVTSSSACRPLAFRWRLTSVSMPSTSTMANSSNRRTDQAEVLSSQDLCLPRDDRATPLRSGRVTSCFLHFCLVAVVRNPLCWSSGFRYLRNHSTVGYTPRIAASVNGLEHHELSTGHLPIAMDESLTRWESARQISDLTSPTHPSRLPLFGSDRRQLGKARRRFAFPETLCQRRIPPIWRGSRVARADPNPDLWVPTITSWNRCRRHRIAGARLGGSRDVLTVSEPLTDLHPVLKAAHRLRSWQTSQSETRAPNGS